MFSAYELAGQKLNGLQIMEICNIKRSILLTNNVLDSETRMLATQKNIKLLPKDLINIFSCKIIQQQSQNKNSLAHVHMVFVDDEKMVTKAIIEEYYNHLIVDQYSNPFEFLECVTKYPKDTKFILDNYYYAEDGGTYPIDGIEIAKQLHDQGYTNLFLLSGQNFSVPDYLTLILKTDKEKIRNLDKL